MKIYGLIVAAGLSSRMNDFKPLMEINKKPMILSTIDSLKSCDIDNICVVVGYRGKEIEEVLKNEDVKVIYNNDYNNSQMYDSFKIGLESVKDEANLLVFLPSDIPLVSKYTINKLVKAYKETNASVVYPVYKEVRGHPPVISSKCFDLLLKYDGSGGLKKALEIFEESSIEVVLPDKFILMDADTKDDYENLKYYLQFKYRPSYDMCIELLKWALAPENIILHSMKVEEIATLIGEELNKKGYNLDLSLIRSASLLHDIKRNNKNHNIEGAKLLRSLGYDDIANIVETHMSLPKNTANIIDEKTIVYLADKLVKEDKLVSLEEKFKNKLVRFEEDKEIYNNIKLKLENAQLIKDNIIGEIGFNAWCNLKLKWKGHN